MNVSFGVICARAAQPPVFLELQRRSLLINLFPTYIQFIEEQAVFGPEAGGRRPAGRVPTWNGHIYDIYIYIYIEIHNIASPENNEYKMISNPCIQ